MLPTGLAIVAIAIVAVVLVIVAIVAIVAQLRSQAQIWRMSFHECLGIYATEKPWGPLRVGLNKCRNFSQSIIGPTKAKGTTHP